MITRRNNPTVLEGNDVDVVLNKSITPFITRALFVFILLFVIQFKLKAQLSKVHYIPPIAYSSEAGSNAIPNQGHYLYLSTPSTSSVTVNVIAIGGATTSLEVSNSIPRVFVVDAPGGADDSQVAIAANDDVAITTSQVISNKGYIVEATSEIYVALRIGQDSQAGALVSKGGAALGTDFRIGAFTNYKPQSNYSTFLSVMATENTTLVTINNISEDIDILDFNEAALGSTSGNLNDITITLNRGESYTMVTRSDQSIDVAAALEVESTQTVNSDGLIGAYVNSDKAVVVNSGSLNGSFGTGTGRDYGFDQIVDYSKVGSEYIFVKGTGSDSWENVLLVAHTDTTTITINGLGVSNGIVHGKGVNVSSSSPAIASASIDAGDYYLIEGDMYSSDGNMYVQSSAPVFAFQGIGFGGGEANQGLFFVPPLKCSSVGDVDNIPEINNIGAENYTGNLNIISKVGAVITISDDNNTNQPISALNVATTSGPFNVTGNANYVSYTISNLNGNVSIISNDELYCSYFNQSGSASSGAFYSGFSSPPEIPNENNGPGLYGYCVPYLGLETGNMDLFTSFEWQYSSGSGYSTVLGSTNQTTITPTLGGSYLIRGFISCPGEPLEFLDSESVTVSLCPPEFTVSQTFLTVNESGTTTKSVLIGLVHKPDSNVVLSISVDDSTEVSVSSTTLTFTPSNWNEQKMIIVTGVDDSIRDSDVTSNIVVSVVDTLSDDDYDSLSDKIIQVRNLDDDLEVCFTRNFDSSEFAINNSAIYQGSGVYRITPNSGFESGSVWYQRRLDLRVEFTFDVDLNFGNLDFSGADGIAFVLQNLDLGQGSSGGGLGYGGITPSYAIEMDTFRNSDDPTSGEDHIGFILNGASSTNQQVSTDVIETTNLEDGNWHNIRVQWIPQTTTLSYTFTHDNGTVYIDTKNIDLIGTVLNSNIAYMGFTASTGGSVNEQSVRFDNNSFCMADEILTPTGASSQTFCLQASPTLNDIVVDNGSDAGGTPYNGVWFSTPNGSASELPITTQLIDGTTYYVEAANLSDTSNIDYRNSLTRLAVTTYLTNGSYTLVPPSLNLIEGTTLATFSLVLNNPPTSPVTYDLASSDLTQMTVSTSSMTFTPLNWNISQVGTLTTVDNTIADGTQSANFTVRINDPLSDDCYVNPNPLPTYAIQIADDEIAGFLLSTVSGTLVENNPQTASVSVVLTAEPLSNIIIDLQSLDTTEATLGTSSITFTPSNWNIPQMILINSVDELLVDGTQTVSITASISSGSDAAFIGVASKTVTVDNQDNDIPGFTVSTLNGSLTEASSQTVTFTVVLDAQPASDVILSLTNSNTSEISLSLTSLTFTNSNWNIPQTITVSSIDDFLIDGTINTLVTISVVECSLDSNANGIPDSFETDIYAFYPFNSNANDESGNNRGNGTINGASLDIDRNGNLNSAYNFDGSNDFIQLPYGYQTLPVSFSAWINTTKSTGEQSIFDSDVSGRYGKSLILGYMNSDNTIDIQYDDGWYDSSKTFSVNNWIHIVGVYSAGNVKLFVDGAYVGEKNFTQDNRPDNSNLRIGRHNSGDPQWFQGRIDDVTIFNTALSPSEINQLSCIGGSDASYSGLTSQALVIPNQDNENVGFTLSAIEGGSLQEASSANVSFTIVLDAQPNPADNVILDITSIDLTEVVVEGSSTPKVFTNANWNIPQTVILKSVDDIILDGTTTNSVTVAVNGLSAPSFLALADQSLNVQNLDNEIPGFQVSNVSGILSEAATPTASFEVVLDVQPLTNVIINLSSNDTTEVDVVAPLFLTFTPATWNVSQTVNLFQVDDFLIDGSQNSSITVSIDAGSDSGFLAAPSKDVLVTTLDNDVAGITIIVLDNLSSESGDTAQFTIQLDAIPTANVTIDLDSSMISEATVGSNQVLFTPANWNIPQRIMVTGIDDSPPISDGSQTVTISTFNVNSTDIDFNAITDDQVADVVVLNQDNDAPGIVLSLLDNNFFTSENGQTVTVQFQLLSRPLGDESVVVPLSIAGDIDEITLSVDSITIEASNWDDPAANQIIVTGQDDFIIDGTRSITLLTGDPSSIEVSHNNLTALDVADVELYNLDNDSPSLIVSQPQSVSENASTTDFTVKLTTSISVSTTILILAEDQTELFVVTPQIVFTPTNWDIPQSVTVIGVDDNIIDGDITSDVVIRVDGSNADPDYRSLLDEIRSIINFDNDRDEDGDGVVDALDNCILISNPDQADIDLDGIGDLCDSDIDGDGVLNTDELSDNTDPNNPCEFIFQSITLAVLETGDCDLDGLINSIDLDDDNDGILDIEELFEDEDSDGIPNTFDLDSDGDGCYDVLEAGFNDQDDDGVLGTGIIEVDALGQVINQGGYVTPADVNLNGVYDFKEENDLIRFETEVAPVTRYSSNRMEFTVSLSLDSFATYQWQINLGSEEFPVWENVVESSLQIGTNTKQLVILQAPKTSIDKQYRVVVNNTAFACQNTVISTTKITESGLFIPNAFSPDGDGVNDTWEIQGLNSRGGYVITIFNRWENIVFKTNQYNNDWQGESVNTALLSSNNLLPDGTYFYLIEWDDNSQPNTGYVYIKRRQNR